MKSAKISLSWKTNFRTEYWDLTQCDIHKYLIIFLDNTIIIRIVTKFSFNLFVPFLCFNFLRHRDVFVSKAFDWQIFHCTFSRLINASCDIDPDFTGWYNYSKQRTFCQLSLRIFYVRLLFCVINKRTVLRIETSHW